MLLPLIVFLVMLILGVVIGFSFEKKQHCFRWLCPFWFIAMIVLLFLVFALQAVVPDFSEYFGSRYLKILLNSFLLIVVFSLGVYIGDWFESR